MSKSKGNGVDPLVLIDRYGSDAVRFKLITAGGTGNDQRLEEPRFAAARNFANKLWNVSRFVLNYLEEGQRVEAITPAMRDSMAVEDRWILSKLDRLTGEVDKFMERFELGEAGRQIEEFIWDVFCDWYVEMAKVRLRAGDSSPLPILVHVLDRALRLLHPYMPYVTEELWSGSGAVRSHLPADDREQLLVADFPKPDGSWIDEAAEREIGLVQEVVVAIRNMRSERNIVAGRWIEAYVVSDRPLAAHAAAIEELARIRPLHIETDRSAAPSESVAAAVLDGAIAILPLAGLIDTAAERASLEKQLAQAQAAIDGGERQLANEKFVNGAPPQVVAETRDRLAAAQARKADIEARLKELH
jgi:valyl-tRNA synthetase